MEKISSPNFSVLKMVLQINGVLPSSFSEVEFAELDDCLLVGRVCFYRLLQQDSTLVSGSWFLREGDSLQIVVEDRSSDVLGSRSSEA
jgi:hypothetical protein